MVCKSAVTAKLQIWGYADSHHKKILQSLKISIFKNKSESFAASDIYIYIYIGYYKEDTKYIDSKTLKLKVRSFKNRRFEKISLKDLKLTSLK